MGEPNGGAVGSPGLFAGVGLVVTQAGLARPAAFGGAPRPHLDEAGEHADRLADADPGTSILRNPTFGPANVQLSRMSAAMQQREPGQVLELALSLEPEKLLAAGP